MKQICDWPQCMRVADFRIRVDVSRDAGFTSLMWVRCGDHTPTPRDGQHITPMQTKS